MRSEADFFMRRNEKHENNPWMDANEQEQEKTGFVPREREEADVGEKRGAEKKEDLPIPTSEQMPRTTEESLPPAERSEDEPSLPSEPSAFDWQKEQAKKTADTPKKKQKRRGGVGGYVLILTALFVAASIFCLAAISRGIRIGKENTTPADLVPPQDGAEGKEKVVFVRQYDDASGLLSLPELYATCSGAVVSIKTKGANVSGVGTGFFLREDGYIATVAHVVDGMEKISVVTADGTSYDATVVASNPLTDLALLKIDGTGFPSVSFGASGELLTGERVIAIGTPASLEYAGSLCTGEVSFALRTVRVYDEAGRVLQKKMKLIQTNAAVNPGNSGCPLFDEYGRVVGIVTMKLGNNAVGISFAIPSDGASAILETMMRGESLSDEVLSLVSTGAPKLGVVGAESESLGIAGVRIVRFSSTRCDAAIKLREGDLIIGIEGRPIATIEAMTALVQEKNPGETILVTVLRSEQRLTFEVILEKS